MSTDIFLATEDEHGRLSVARPVDIVFEEVKDGEIREPTFRFDDRVGTHFLEALAQALIDSGFRDKTVSKDGEIKRMENHLDDLKKILFKKLLIGD